MSLMVKSLHIMNFKGGSKSHGSNAHEIWTRGSISHGGPFLMVHLRVVNQASTYLRLNARKLSCAKISTFTVNFTGMT